MDKLEIVKLAKSIFMDSFYLGMCPCFCKALLQNKYHFSEISKIIPEFNREFLEAQKDRNYSLWWWDPMDKESRIKAFDKLIHYYEVNGQGELQKGS